EDPSAQVFDANIFLANWSGVHRQPPFGGHSSSRPQLEIHYVLSSKCQGLVRDAYSNLRFAARVKILCLCENKEYHNTKRIHFTGRDEFCVPFSARYAGRAVA